jgi:hypothetical protein
MSEVLPRVKTEAQEIGFIKKRGCEWFKAEIARRKIRLKKIRWKDERRLVLLEVKQKEQNWIRKRGSLRRNCRTNFRAFFGFCSVNQY